MMIADSIHMRIATLTTAEKQSFVFQRAGHIRAAGDFRLYHTPDNLSIGKINKIIIQENPEFVQHYHLHFTSGCGIIIVSRGERNKPLLGLSPSEVKLGTPHKKHERTSRKPLDKLHTMWYTIIVKRGYTPPEINRHQGANGKQIAGGWKDFQKIFQIY